MKLLPQMIKYITILYIICASASAEIKNIICYELGGNSTFYKEDGSGEHKKPDKNRENRHRWFVNKKINDLSESRKNLIISLLKEEKSYVRGSQIMCYQPRFSITYEESGNKVEYHICLNCHNRNKYVNGKIEEREVTFSDDAYKEIKTLIEGKDATSHPPNGP